MDSPADSPADTSRTRADGTQAAPGLLHLLRSSGSVLSRLPGMVRTTGSYVAHRTSVDHQVVDVEGLPHDAPDGERTLPGDERTVLRRKDGRGPLYRRTYEVLVDGPTTSPEQLIGMLLRDPNEASPTEVSEFVEADGASREEGAEFAVRMPGPWDAPVRVVDRTPTSFSFVTLRGHLEAGEIAFRAEPADDGRLRFTIESWARSGDRLYDWLYDKVPLTREMQLHMWSHVCEQVAVMSGGRQVGNVRVTTHRWKEADRG